MHWPILRVKVAERSMEPALRPGDWLLVRRTRRIHSGQVVLARHPERPEMLIVKRAARRADAVIKHPFRTLGRGHRRRNGQ